MNPLIEELNKLADTYYKHSEIKHLIDRAIYELEHQFNPSDGVWVIRRNGRAGTKIVELDDLEGLENKVRELLESEK